MHRVICWPDQYLTHAHSRITWAVAATGQLFRPYWGSSAWHSCWVNEQGKSSCIMLGWCPGGYSPTLPIRVCAAWRGCDFEAPDLEWGIKNCGSRLYFLLKIIADYEEAFIWCISRTNKEISLKKNRAISIYKLSRTEYKKLTHF